MRNPFIRYSPLEDQIDWCGSTEIFTLLSDHVRARNNVCILGVQGSGKTSLLQAFFNIDYLFQMVQEERTIICSVDLSNQQSGSDICLYLAERIKSTVRMLLTESPHYQRIMGSLNGENATNQLALLENIISILHMYRYHVVLVIDRFERFTSSPSVTMDHHETLRTLIEANKLRCIVATNSDLSKDSLTPGVKGSYLMQKFTNSILLPSMATNVALEYIQKQQKGINVQLSKALIEKLTEISGGIPLLLEYAAECAFDNISKNNGKVNSRELLTAIYEKAKPILKSWCDSLTSTQIRVLKMLAKDSLNTKIATFDFTGCDGDIKEAVEALRLRGMLISSDIEYQFEVCANSLLLQRYCRDDLKEPEAQLSIPTQAPVFSAVPNSGGNTYNFYLQGDVYQGNAVNSSSHLTVENAQINNGLSTSELLHLLTGTEVPGRSIDSRKVFAAQLSSQLRKYIPNTGTPLLLPDSQAPEHIYAQAYDTEFDKLSQKLVCDVEVDEDEDLVVTPAELQTLETRFAEARTRCRIGLSDELLSSQSERCQFYIKLSVVVEDALELPGIQMDDYSPQLILYGKACEQSLRDNFYELFHKESKISAFSTYSQKEDKNDPKAFANKRVKDTLIGNYIYLMTAMRHHLATLCQSNSIHTINQPSDVNEWTQWWKNFEYDVCEARDIRNLAAHTDPVLSPSKENLEKMCKLLFGNFSGSGLLSRALVGTELLQQIFPPTISFEIAQKFVGKQCRMKCKTVKRNGGLNGITTEGGYAVNISPKRVLAYRNEHLCENFDFSEKELVVSVLECKTQDNREFFAAEIVSVVS